MASCNSSRRSYSSATTAAHGPDHGRGWRTGPSSAPSLRALELCRTGVVGLQLEPAHSTWSRLGTGHRRRRRRTGFSRRPRKALQSCRRVRPGRIEEACRPSPKISPTRGVCRWWIRGGAARGRGRTLACGKDAAGVARWCRRAGIG
jgi:hypothetical protein